jgi:hypothetical protein
LIGTAAGFWWFELRSLRLFETDATRVFDAGTRAEAAQAWYRATNPPGAIPGPAATVVYFFKPGCSCNRFTEAHLARIRARYPQAQVRFVAATREEAAATPLGLARLPIPDRPDLDWLAAAPAALVFDRDGKLVYFGPYSNAAWCGAKGGLVEQILDRLLAGRPTVLQPFYGRGCFCAR